MNLFYTLFFSLFLLTPIVEKSAEKKVEEDVALFAPGDELTDDGSTVRIDYSGTYEDFAIPADTDVEVLTFFLMGGDGGTRNVCGDAAKGGRGARVDLSFRIGSEAGKLEPGGIIRFIVGQDGANQNSNAGGGAGGGGGTAILYASPRADTATFDDVPSLDLAEADNDWVILAVAGGGGGSHGRAPDTPISFAVNGPCVRGSSQDGRGASEETYGGTGSNFNSIVERVGGEDGEGGKSRLDRGGGAGGGYLGDGEGEEATGGGRGGITGGAGGVDNSGISARGGFGYGGGGTGYARSGSFGGGGGGGGFSGGDGGNAPNGGGGGGSFVNPAAIIQDNSIQGGRATTNPVHGFITYQFFVLQASGEEAHVPYIGSYRDLMIPTDLDLSQFDGIAFSMRGGDGGRAISTENGILRARGGKGAFVSLKFPVGDNPNQLQRGGTLRFIVGSEGSSNRSKRATGAGGGGGTAILYRPPGVTGDGDCVVTVPGA
ncbi:MAG: hypothetical protein AAF705_01415, partial [Bacteroidota bacterium]